VDIYVGVPGDVVSAGQGYVSVEALNVITQSVSHLREFAGVMVWEAVSAANNIVGSGSFASSVSQQLKSICRA
jgi:chitinase